MIKSICSFFNPSGGRREGVVVGRGCVDGADKAYRRGREKEEVVMVRDKVEEGGRREGVA